MGRRQRGQPEPRAAVVEPALAVRGRSARPGPACARTGCRRGGAGAGALIEKCGKPGTWCTCGTTVATGTLGRPRAWGRRQGRPRRDVGPEVADELARDLRRQQRRLKGFSGAAVGRPGTGARDAIPAPPRAKRRALRGLDPILAPAAEGVRPAARSPGRVPGVAERAEEDLEARAGAEVADHLGTRLRRPRAVALDRASEECFAVVPRCSTAARRRSRARGSPSGRDDHRPADPCCSAGRCTRTS